MVLLMHATTAYRMGTSRLRLGSQLFATTSLPSGRESPSSKLIHANSKEAPVKEAINPLLVHVRYS